MALWIDSDENMAVPDTRYQIRIRTDKQFNELDYIREWLDQSAKGFAFMHDKPGNRHYHIYLFGLQREADSMRKHLGKYVGRKVDYCVKTRAGPKNNKFIVDWDAWTYATTDAYLDPVWTKGYTNETILEFKRQAETHYDIEKEPSEEERRIIREDHYVVRPDMVWQRLSAQYEDYKDLSYKEIKSKICAQWLNAGKAIPRSSDLHRYAISLYLNNKYPGGVPDDAYSSALSSLS